MKARPPFFASHGLAILHLAREPEMTMRQLAAALDVSERRVARILRELKATGIISVTKAGNRNRYTINEEAVLPYPTIASSNLGDLIRGVLGDSHRLEQARDKRRSLGLLHSFMVPLSLAESEMSWLSGLIPILA